MVHIRKGVISDAAVISFLGRQTFAETFGYLFSEIELNTYLDETFGIQKLEGSLHKPSNIFSILYYDEQPVGYYKVKIGSGYDITNEKQAQLQKIYILEEYVDKKLGAVLLDDMLALEELKNKENIWLVVLHTNYCAIQFYEKNGFEKLRKYYHEIGGQTLEYKLMVKNL